jgi:hypothetical protein
MRAEARMSLLRNACVFEIALLSDRRPSERRQDIYLAG